MMHANHDDPRAGPTRTRQPAGISRRDFSLLAGVSLLAPQAKAATTWRLATGYRGDMFHTVNISTMARDVSIATQGALQIEVHPNNSLFKLADVRGAVEAGKVEAGETLMSTLVKEIPIAAADSVPFIVSSFADAKRMWRYQRPLIEQHFAERGLAVLYAVSWPPQGLFCNTAIKNGSEFAGTHMRTYNSTTARIATLLGAQAVDVAASDVDNALSNGRVDSMITSGVTGAESRVWAHLKYFYEIYAWFPKNIVFANAKALAALDAPVRQALMQHAAAAETRGWAAAELAAAKSVDDLRSNGMKVVKVEPEFNTRIKRLGERFSLEWIRQVGSEANGIFVPYFTNA